MIIICPVVEKQIKGPCTVKTCMWWSAANPAGCIAQEAFPDPEDLTDEIVAQHKGLTVKDVSILRKRGSRTIERILVLYRYFDWINETIRPHQYPYVAGYADPELQHFVNGWVADRWPFTVPHLDWNIGRVYCALSSTLWSRYSKHVNTDIDGLRIVGVDRLEAKMVLSKFRAAARSMEKQT